MTVLAGPECVLSLPEAPDVGEPLPLDLFEAARRAGPPAAREFCIYPQSDNYEDCRIVQLWADGAEAQEADKALLRRLISTVIDTGHDLPLAGLLGLVDTREVADETHQRQGLVHKDRTDISFIASDLLTTLKVCGNKIVIPSPLWNIWENTEEITLRTLMRLSHNLIEGIGIKIVPAEPGQIIDASDYYHVGQKNITGSPIAKTFAAIYRPNLD